ncbi:MAG: hypothetical protein KBS58_00950 [Bacteroidales bacterium]|nr:hypothetical protein [Candidatus Cacconaster equi]
MKKSILFAFGLLVCTVLTGYAQPSELEKQLMQKQMDYQLSRMGRKEEVKINRKWTIVSKIGETTVLMAIPDLHCWYLGEISIASRKNIRSGKGLYMGEDETCYCNWKRDSKHGDGFLLQEDGEIVACTWKWNVLDKKSIRAATDDERAFFESEIKRTKKLVSISQPRFR